MIGGLSKNFHGVGIGPLSKILAVKQYSYLWVCCFHRGLVDDKANPSNQYGLHC